MVAVFIFGDVVVRAQVVVRVPVGAAFICRQPN
jgi:hypothetical protein